MYVLSVKSLASVKDYITQGHWLSLITYGNWSILVLFNTWVAVFGIVMFVVFQEVTSTLQHGCGRDGGVC